jgi:hypothetical protein
MLRKALIEFHDRSRWSHRLRRGPLAAWQEEGPRHHLSRGSWHRWAAPAQVAVIRR